MVKAVLLKMKLDVGGTCEGGYQGPFPRYPRTVDPPLPAAMQRKRHAGRDSIWQLRRFRVPMHYPAPRDPTAEPSLIGQYEAAPIEGLDDARLGGTLLRS